MAFLVCLEVKNDTFMSKQKYNCHFMVKIIRHLANNCQFHPELFLIRMWKNLHLNWTSRPRSDPTEPQASRGTKIQFWGKKCD